MKKILLVLAGMMGIAVLSITALYLNWRYQESLPLENCIVQPPDTPINTPDDIHFVEHFFIESTNTYRQDIAFSPDSQFLAVATQIEGTFISIYDVETGELFQRIELNIGHFIDNVIFSPDGSLLAAVIDLDTIRIWDWQNVIMVANFRSSESREISDIIFGETSNTLISVSSRDDIQFWDIDTEELTHSISFRWSVADELAINEQRNCLLVSTVTGTSGQSGSIFLIDLSNNRKQTIYSGWSSSNNGFTTNDNVVGGIPVAFGETGFFDIQTQEQVYSIYESSMWRSTPAYNLLFFRGYNTKTFELLPTITILEPPDRYISSINFPDDARIIDFDVSPDGNYIAIAGLDGITVLQND